MAPRHSLLRLSLMSALVLVSACKKQSETKPEDAKQASAESTQTKPQGKTLMVGLVTDVGGRGDQSFNDSALRGLELWGAGKKMEGGSYKDVTPEELKASLPPDLASHGIVPLAVTPVVLQSKVAEDYEPSLQLLVDQGAALSVGGGFSLESAVETVAKRNPDAKFLLIDSPLVGTDGQPYSLPNVRTVEFKEHEGSFLVGALAGLVTQANKVGFVGGKEVPLIKKFEAGFRAGVAATNPKATVLVNYTGNFDNVADGKQVAQDLVSKGADILYHAAGADGLGVIHAVKEARDANKPVFAIGVDSDQSHLAPDAVLTSMVKRVDLAVYEAVRDLSQGKLQGGDVVLGLKEGGVSYAPVRVEFPKRAEALEKVEQLRAQIVAGEITVPSHPSQLTGTPAK
ncbi:BMP family lipoprotein [Melittangium boletus]|uniref:Bis(5'-nucleosyl)-tetraphosphatase n=1 Tax=Melittangium boletus DSM 14713 TaxID=1294270 RepID=A0A250IAI3_9BACT|nr:BMP family ABC transporter substrate-binding protein [Melittangium boletus]ATB28775.1 bis(5'-nucleosyl)-tetraphosphatase [Melittangium boletus DSM 14713]